MSKVDMQSAALAYTRHISRLADIREITGTIVREQLFHSASRFVEAPEWKNSKSKRGKL
jgi:hypothetical protein